MIKQACIKASKELNIPEEVVEEAYKSYWKFLRDTIQGLPLKKDLTEEEFNNLRTSFNIPSLGKLACTYERYVNMKKRFEYINKIKDDKVEED